MATTVFIRDYAEESEPIVCTVNDSQLKLLRFLCDNDVLYWDYCHIYQDLATEEE